MTDQARKTKIRIIVLMLWILLAAFYFSLTYEYISASNRDTSLEEYLRYIVVVCGDDRRPNKEVRSLVLAKAEELMIDLRGDQIAVTGYGQTLKISVSYMVDINVPVLQTSIYRKVFQHDTAYRNIR